MTSGSFGAGRYRELRTEDYVPPVDGRLGVVLTYYGGGEMLRRRGVGAATPVYLPEQRMCVCLVRDHAGPASALLTGEHAYCALTAHSQISIVQLIACGSRCVCVCVCCRCHCTH